MTEQERLERAIAALEVQRALLGDAVVDTALDPLRERLAALAAVQHSAPAPPQTSGEQRQLLTVLFADVHGFTRLAERLDAEEVQDLLSDLWQRLDKLILDHDGHIDKHLGDGVMAIWGLPSLREDDAIRAVRAALAMQAEVGSWGLEVGGWKVDDGLVPDRKSTDLDLQIRIGVNTGLAAVSWIVSTGERNVIGDAVNVAARLQEAAPPGGIFISRATYDLVRGLFAVHEELLLNAKGRSEAVTVYRVLSEKPRAFFMATRGLAGVATRTVGREGELALLQESYEEAVAGSALRWITVSGEAGVGKSRLLAEFESWLELRPERIRCLKGRAWPQTEGSPYFLLRDLLSFRFQVRESDPQDVARQKLTEGLSEMLGDELGEEAAAFVGQLMGLDMRQSRHIRHIAEDTRQIRGRAEVLLGEYLSRLAVAGPVVLLLEDLQWADEESLRLLAGLLAPLSSSPLLVVGLARPAFWERGLPWGQDATGQESPGSRRLDLAPLSDALAEELVCEILQRLPDPPAWLVEMLVERGGGNPYFTEELVQWLIEQGVIEVGLERWQVHAQRSVGLSVPGSVQGVLQARLERLGLEERAVLQCAAVVGRSFWHGAVVHVGQQPVPAERWEALQRRELVFHQPVSRLPDEEEYIFKHVLLRDVVYEYTLKKVRRVFHRRAAEWLSRVAAERAGEWAGVIAAHYEKAGEEEPAAEWYWRAGEQARNTYAPESAIGYYRRALAFCPAGAAYAGRRIDLYRRLGQMLRWRLCGDEADEVYRAMLAAAQEVEDRPAQVWAWCGLSANQSKTGDLRAALSSAEQAAEIARSLPEPSLLAEAYSALSWVHHRLGDAARSEYLAEQALTIATELDDPDGVAANLTLLGAASWIRGHYPQAARFWERALQSRRERGDRSAAASLLNNLGANAYMQGDYQAAADLFREALTNAQQIGFREIEWLSHSNLGGALVGLGEYAAAEAVLLQVLDFTAGSGLYELPNTYRFLAEAYLGQGMVDRAREAVTRSLELARQMEAQDLIGRAWRTLGLVLARQHEPITVEGRVYDAPACFAESQRIFVAKGAESELARTLRDWGEYERARGEAGRAQDLCRQAREVFLRLGMAREAERTACS